MKIMKTFVLLLSALLMGGALSGAAYADDDEHRVVIQISTNDPLTQKIVLNNAVNLQKAFGAGNVEIEIVAYGPGLSLLTKANSQSTRVKSLAVDDDITFSACNNTMKKMAKKTGKKPVLTEGVTIVPSGAYRIIQLQEKGWSYLRP